MPGFADNLQRMCRAAGMPVAEAGRRLGAMPAEVAAWMAPSARLPELHVLVRLADALGCRVDDLLTGEDTDFDHPQRRHAALIAARMGRVRTLLSQVRLARHRKALGAEHEAQLDEAALLLTVDQCRAWVMSEDHAVDEAAAIEAALDAHVARVQGVLERVSPSGPARDARPPAAPASPQPAAASPPAPVPATAAPPPSVDSPEDAAAPPRRPGHRSRLWSHEYADQTHACVLVTHASGVAVELQVDDRVLESRTCQTLDEAFAQSSEWKRTYLAPAILALPDIPR